MMKPFKVYILVSLCVLFWSGNFVLGRFVKDDIDPLELAFFRWFFVIVLLLPSFYFVNIKRILKLTKSHFFIVSAMAITSVTLYNTIVYTALQTTTTTNALLINSGTPILILLLSIIILKTLITKLQILGVFLSAIGVIFLILKGDVNTLLNLDFHHGDIWMIFSSISWAIYSILLKFKPKNFSNSEFFVANMYVGFIYLTPLYFMQGFTIESQIMLISEYWHFFLYISLFASILSYIFWNIGVDNIGAAKTSQFAHLMPLFGSILAFVFLGEELKSYHIIGALLIALGIYLSLFFKTNIVKK